MTARIKAISISLIIVGLSLIVVFKQSRLTKCLSISSEDTFFSAERAMLHLDSIATIPRSVGSIGHELTRQYLFRELRRMGLSPEIQETTSLLRFPNASGFSAANIQNILVRIPGTAVNRKAIALDAHYDGGSSGPAAGDCGSGVIVLLETIRSILANPPLRNDLIFVFADAEEIGDLGAHAFATQHPWMDDIAIVLNYEGMGTTGPAYLYATNDNNHHVIQLFEKSKTSILANSFISGIVKRFPDQRLACDLQDYLDHGSSGYGFVFTGNTSAYHTELDSIENLSPQTVQQMGTGTLKLLRHLGNTDLYNLSCDDDEVFFSIWPNTLINYPAKTSKILAILGFIFLLHIISRNVRHKHLGFGEVVVSTLAFFISIFITVVICALTWLLVKSVNPNLQAYIIGNWAVNWFITFIILIAFTLMTWGVSLFPKKIDYNNRLAGALVGFSLLSILLAVEYPEGSFIVLWPVWFSLIVLSLLLDNDVWASPMKSALAALLIAIPAILLFLPLMSFSNPLTGILIRFDAMTGLPILGLVALLPALLFGLLEPLIAIFHIDESVYSQRLNGTALIGVALSMLALGFGWINSGFDRQHPHPESIRYELDMDQQIANWVTGDPILGDWTLQFIPSDTKHAYQANASLLPKWPTTYVSSAPVINIDPPILEVLDERIDGELKKVKLRLKSAFSGSMLTAQIKTSSPIKFAQVNDQVFDLTNYELASQGELLLNYGACPIEGIEMVLHFEGNSVINVSLVDLKNDLPMELSQSRPATTMPSPIGADCTVVRKSFTISPI